MKNDLKYIDEFVKAKLANHTEATETVVWDRLKWSLFWMRHKWLISLSSVVILLGIGSIVSYSLINNPENLNNSQNVTLLTSGNNTDEFNQKSENENTILLNENSNQLKTSQNIKVTPAEDFSSNIENNNEATEMDLNSLLADNSSSFNNIYDGLMRENMSADESHNTAFNGINSLDFKYSISINPDSNLLGFNRRTDILPPGTKKLMISMNVFTGPSYSQSTITNYNSEYLAYRNSNESNNPGWTIGADMKIHIKNWIITSGINYSVYNQKRSYIKKYQEYSPENSYFDYDTSWVWVYDSPDFGIPMVKDIDSSWVKVYDDITIDNSGINQMKYFEIPIMIGYRFNSNMFALEINAGVSAAFLSYSNLKVPDFLDTDEIIDADNINKTMFNFVTNVSLYYHLNRNTSLFLSPYFKQNLHSVFNETYPLKQQFKTYGLNFGVNIRF
jgi:hypothetical protein